MFCVPREGGKCFISYFTVLSKAETDTLNSSFQREKKSTFNNISDRSYLHFLEIIFLLIAFQGQKLNIPHLYYGGSSRNFTIFNLKLINFLVAQTVKRLLTVQETRVQSLGQEDLLEKEMATHSSILAWKIPWMEKPCRLQSMGLQRV